MRVEIEFEIDRIPSEDETALYEFLSSLCEGLESQKRVFNLNMFYDPRKD